MKSIKCFMLSVLLLCISTSTVYAGNNPASPSFDIREELYLKVMEKRIEQRQRDNEKAIQAMSLVWKLEEGGLQDDATEELLDAAIEQMKSVHDENLKETLQGMANAADKELHKPAEHYYGACTITHYCNCSICAGQWAGGNTASGTVPTAGRTIAMDLPFGTQVRIGDHIYTVEDRGVSGMWVDIYVDNHSEALARGMYTADVYILD